MKCPKCHYIGFETGDRCKNCGYEFALMLQTDVAVAAPIDLSLRPPENEPADLAGPALPLFELEEEFDAPLVKSAPPRQPIAVRKTPEAQRTRLARTVTPQAAKSPALELSATEQELPLLSVPEPVAGQAAAAPAQATAGVVTAPAAPAGPVGAWPARVLAAGIDYLLLGCIDLVVVHFTLRLTALAMEDWRLIPLPPLVVFLVGVKLAYFTTFTAAGGQTIGKMATGLRVVGDAAGDPPMWDAVRRAFVEVASLVALGLPFLLALRDPARRSLHDRVAGTRVVPA